MNRITPIDVPLYGSSYCEQGTAKLPPPFNTVEEGAEIIEKMLEVPMLCKHDVININQVYQEMDQMEQREQVSLNGSLKALQTIVDKVEALFARLNTCVTEGFRNIDDLRSILSLYHLQSFSDGEFIPFNNFWSKLRGTVKPEELAPILPCCYSEADFDQDIAFFIGSNRNATIDTLLKQKKEKLQSYEKAREESLRRKKELEFLRNNNPRDNYPTHFDLLLEEGYVHLYDHLIQMRTLSNRHERESSIKQMSFSAMSHVILETRRAIIQKVNNSIPPDATKILFLVGNTYSGKSTTLCFLRGDKMVSKKAQYESQSDEDNLIGRPGEPSCTFLPNSTQVGKFIIIDFPGFEDTNGSLVSIGMQLALQALVEKHNPRILALSALTSKDSNFGAASRLGRLLNRLLSNSAREAHRKAMKKSQKKGEPIPALTLIPGITQYLGDGRYHTIKTMEKHEEQYKKKIKDLEQKEKVLLDTRNQLFTDLNNLKLPEERNNKKCALEENEKILESVQAEKEQLLLEIEEKEGCMADLKIDEKRLLAELQLSEQNLIRFDDLQSPGRLTACLQLLSRFFDDEAYCITAGKSWNFDESQESLAKQFKEKLLAEVETVAGYYTDFNTFKTDVLEFGFFGALFSKSHPEISQFLNVPEIDSSIAKDYENTIMKNYTDKLIRHAIADIDLELVRTILEEMTAVASAGQRDALQEEILQLQYYVMGALGVPTSNKLTEAWQKLRDTYRQAREEAGKNQLSTWAMVLFALPMGIPLALHQLSKWLKIRAEKKAADACIDQCRQDLHQVCTALIMLKEIERTILERKKIAKAFNSVLISLESMDTLRETMQARISKVRSVYGAKEWDDRLALEPMPSNPLYSGTLPGAAKAMTDRLFNIQMVATAYMWIDPKPSPDKLYQLLSTQTDNIQEPLNTSQSNYILLAGMNVIAAMTRKSEIIANGILALLLIGISIDERITGQYALSNGMEALKKACFDNTALNQERPSPVTRALKTAALLRG